MKVQTLLESPQTSIVEYVRSNCEKWTAETTRPFYRGIRKFVPLTVPFPGVYGTDASIWKTQQDRKPMTSESWFHDKLNDALYQHFGTKYRSSSTFVTPFKDTAGIYGEVFVMIPIGEYEYLWSPIVSDATFDLQDIHIAGFLYAPFRQAHMHGAAYDKRLEKVGKVVLKSMKELGLIESKGDSEMTDKEYALYADQVYGTDTKLIISHVLDHHFDALGYKQDGIQSNIRSETMIACDKYLMVKGKALAELKEAGIIK